MRRTRVFVSLFGSSLHNCRLLPPGSLVLELHGALKEDWHSAGYAALCAQDMQLRWVGVAAENAVPALAGNDTHLKHGAHSYRRSPDYAAARMNASRIIQALDAGLRADWSAAFSSYPLPVLGSIKPMHATGFQNVISGVNPPSHAQTRTTRLLLIRSIPKCAMVAASERMEGGVL